MPPHAPPTRRATLAFAALALTARAQAQPAFPDHPLRWIIGYPPGGTMDVTARILNAALAAALGQPVVIDNRPGAGAIIATEAAAHAPPDGYTFLSGETGNLVYNRALYRHIPYDPERDFRPVSLIARYHFLLAVHDAVPARTAAEFIALARARPGAVTMATLGPGSPHNLATIRLGRATDAQFTPVPYRGGGPAVNDLAAGTVMGMFVDYGTGAALFDSGRIRPLAIASDRRMPPYPEIPTLAELGYPDTEIYAWQGALVPAGTPDAVVERLSTAIATAVNDPAVVARLRQLGVEPRGTTPAEFRRTIEAEAATWLPLIRDLGITVDG